MEGAVAYLTDLAVEPIAQRDFGADHDSFEHYIRADEGASYYEGIAGQFNDGQEIVDKVLGDGWEAQDETNGLKAYIRMYERDQKPTHLKRLFQHLHAARDHITKAKHSHAAPRVAAQADEGVEEKAEYISTPDMIRENKELIYDSQEHVDDMRQAFDMTRVRRLLGGLHSDHMPSPEDIEMMNSVTAVDESGYVTPIKGLVAEMQPATPIQSVVEPRVENTVGAFEPVSEQAFTYSSPGGQAGGWGGATEAISEHKEPELNRIEVDHDEKVAESEPHRTQDVGVQAVERPIVVRTLQPGRSKTIYLRGRREIHVPEPSMHDRHRIFDTASRALRPASAKHAHSQKSLGDFVVLERTGTRFHIEVEAKIPEKSCNRLVNLIRLHGKKIPGAILNQTVNGVEHSHGPISSLSKGQLKRIISSVATRTSFIVIGPTGGGLGVLGSNFWTHPHWRGILSRR
jgi:hypothetical protein